MSERDERLCDAHFFAILEDFAGYRRAWVASAERGEFRLPYFTRMCCAASALVARQMIAEKNAKSLQSAALLSGDERAYSCCTRCFSELAAAGRAGDEAGAFEALARACIWSDKATDESFDEEEALERVAAIFSRSQEGDGR